jgi:signal transduction histidine kinase
MKPSVSADQIPKNNTWSVFIYWPTDTSVAPVIIGIQYANKERYLSSTNEELYWEKYVLPKYCVYIQGLVASRIAQKRADTLDDSRVVQEHEMGQINTAVQLLGERFNRYINGVQNYLRQKLKDYGYYEKLDSKLSDFTHRANLYREDMEAQFQLAYMLSKIYDEMEVNPEPFDIFTKFLNKWRFCFKAKCNEKYNRLDIPYYDAGQSERWMHTDPQMLEYVVYNIVNNAIKYSYINTPINIVLSKSEDYHLLSVTNYGIYLQPNDSTIFDKGVRKTNGNTLTQVPVVEAISSGKTEGKGLGLYWSKRLADAIGCEITYQSEKVSEYYVPLVRLFVNQWQSGDSKLFHAYWNALVQNEHSEKKKSHTAIKDEYDRLDAKDGKGKCEYDKLINNQEEDFGNRIGLYVLFEDIVMPTYRVSFTIKIPRYAKEAQ